MGNPLYKRVVLKLSGEWLAGNKASCIDPEALTFISNEIISAKNSPVELALVVGGGNVIRGQFAAAGSLDRVSADQMGMLATVINSLALRDNLESMGVATQVLSAIHIEALTRPYTKREAVGLLQDGKVIILAGGTGNAYFTTDTTAALRAAEIEADAVFKGTKVDGVFDDDPVKNPQARMFEKVTYAEVFRRRLKVMDLTAISLCMENKIPIVVFNLKKPGNLKRILSGEKVGSRVEG